MTAALRVLSPVTGTVVAMADVPDPVFAASLVGPGVAIEPDTEQGTEVRAPIDGTVVKLHPHAFVVQAADGRGVLVHLGINTVQLDGEGFTLHVAEGDAVSAEQVLISWDIAAIAETGRSTVCPVVALDARTDAVGDLAEVDALAGAQTALYTWS
ncbi:PTS sugar transporter subunit IIA [Demequina sediminicola]|uniref:PTS sugar transporter subunit IIA n=1 Tax=Demequina sediminicola TaxID=1095026 RepID=UPI000AF10F49|nr:PTS glucose transporter subunit IIA [Demequina sediminicola]